MTVSQRPRLQLGEEAALELMVLCLSGSKANLPGTKEKIDRLTSVHVAQAARTSAATISCAFPLRIATPMAARQRPDHSHDLHTEDVTLGYMSNYRAVGYASASAEMMAAWPPLRACVRACSERPTLSDRPLCGKVSYESIGRCAPM